MRSVIPYIAIVAVFLALMSVGSAAQFSSGMFKDLKTNSSSNMSSSEMDIISNVVYAAERRYTVDQIEEIANFVSKTLSDLWNNVWPVIILKSSKSVDYIGWNIFTLKSKGASFTYLGSYRFAYLIFQRTYCLTPSATFASNDSAPVMKFGDPSNDTQIEMIKSAVYNSIFYAGESTSRGATYISNRLTSADGRSWSALIVSATGAVYSSSYFCPQKNLWAMMIVILTLSIITMFGQVKHDPMYDLLCDRIRLQTFIKHIHTLYLPYI